MAYAKTIFEEAKSKQASHSNDSVVEKLSRKITMNEVQIESLVKRIATLPESLDAKPFYDEIKRLQDQTLRLRAEIEVLKEKDYSQIEFINFEDFQKFTVNLKALAEKETRPEAKAAIIRRLVSSIHVTPDGIEIQYHASRDHFKIELGGTAPGSSNPSATITNPLKINFNRPYTKPLNKYSKNNFYDAGSTSLKFGRGLGT